MKKRIITYLLFSIAALLYLTLLWFIGYCNVIPEIYPVQKNIAWSGLLVFFVLIFIISRKYKAEKASKLKWIGIIYCLLGMLCMTYRLFIKQDGRWSAAISLYDERKYRYTWNSETDSIELYSFYSPSSLSSSSESIWQRKKGSIYMKKIWEAKYGRVDSITESASEVMIYAKDFAIGKKVHLRLDKKTNSINQTLHNYKGLFFE